MSKENSIAMEAEKEQLIEAFFSRNWRIFFFVEQIIVWDPGKQYLAKIPAFILHEQAGDITSSEKTLKEIITRA